MPVSPGYNPLARKAALFFRRDHPHPAARRQRALGGVIHRLHLDRGQNKFSRVARVDSREKHLDVPTLQIKIRENPVVPHVLVIAP